MGAIYKKKRKEIEESAGASLLLLKRKFARISKKEITTGPFHKPPPSKKLQRLEEREQIVTGESKNDLPRS
jgi:hypothetical protein